MTKSRTIVGAGVIAVAIGAVAVAAHVQLDSRWSGTFTYSTEMLESQARASAKPAAPAVAQASDKNS